MFQYLSYHVRYLTCSLASFIGAIRVVPIALMCINYNATKPTYDRAK